MQRLSDETRDLLKQVSTPTLTTAAQGYDLDLHGDGTTITNAVTFANSGTLQLGNAASDVLLFNVESEAELHQLDRIARDDGSRRRGHDDACDR